MHNKQRLESLSDFRDIKIYIYILNKLKTHSRVTNF